MHDTNDCVENMPSDRVHSWLNLYFYLYNDVLYLSSFTVRKSKTNFTVPKCFHLFINSTEELTLLILWCGIISWETETHVTLNVLM